MSDIIWLASYPKSGNTWLRVFLANYQSKHERPVDLNALGVGQIASNRSLFDEALGIESSDLTADEIERARPSVYRRVAAEASETVLLKTHDAYTITSAGEPWVPSDATRGAIYIVRNPLDVAVSFAHHIRKPIGAAIERMAEPDAALAKETEHLNTQVRQKLLTWSGHVISWLEQKEFPVHLIRYEDMLASPVESFGAAVRFIGWEYDTARIEQAVRFSAFENLQRQESEAGFKEKPLGMVAFFRKGKAGSWREELNKNQIEKIMHDHGAVMRRLGYLKENGYNERNDDRPQLHRQPSRRGAIQTVG